MQALGPAQPALPPEQLLALFPQAIDQLLAAIKDPVHEQERLVQVRKGRYNWRMIKGDHFIAPDFTSDSAGNEIIDYVSVDSFSGDGETGDQVAFAYPVNVLAGDCSKFVAVMGQAAPRVKAVADDATADDSLERTKNADAILRNARVKQAWDRLQRVLAFHQYVTGPSFAYTPFVTDALKYGSTTEPQVNVEEQPQEDGSTLPMPVNGEPQEYANGEVELHLETILTVSITFGVKDLKEAGWLNYEVAQNKWKLIATFPEDLGEFRDADPPDDDSDATTIAGAQAADSVKNPTGQGRPKKQSEWRLRRVWIQPHYFEAIQNEEARAIYKRQFPEGLRIVRVGSKTIAKQLKSENLTDVWAVCRTGKDENILSDPLCSDAVPIQRCLNDLVNLAIETVLRSIAKTIVDAMLLDRRALSTKEALPAEVLFTLSPMGTDISKLIAQIPPATVSNQLVPLFEMLRGLMQDITNIRPEVTGGGVPTDTYREAKQRKDQALMGLSPQAKEIAAFWEQVAKNVVGQTSRYGAGTLSVPRQSKFGAKNDVIDLAQLSEEGLHYEADDGIPMSFTDLADRLFNLLKENPDVAAILGMLDPLNLDENLELLQLPEHQSPQQNQKKKTLADIQQLMAAQAIPGQPGPDGQPGPSQPSLPVDGYDDHAFVALFLARWLVDAPQEDRQSPGFSNVVAFQAAHQALVTPPAPPPPPNTRTGLNVTAKAEDMGPDFLNELLQSAGMGPLPRIPPGQMDPTQQAPPAPHMAPGGPKGKAAKPANGLPPLPPGPELESPEPPTL